MFTIRLARTCHWLLLLLSLLYSGHVDAVARRHCGTGTGDSWSSVLGLFLWFLLLLVFQFLSLLLLLRCRWVLSPNRQHTKLHWHSPVLCPSLWPSRTRYSPARPCTLTILNFYYFFPFRRLGAARRASDSLRFRGSFMNMNGLARAF